MRAAALDRVADSLRADGGLLAAALLPDGPVVPPNDPDLASLVASGPRAADDPDLLAAVVEAAHEGHLLHHGRSRLLDAADGDLALLAGDRLYALGLAWLSERGDVDAVRELAGVIALCARAQAHDDDELPGAAWEAGAIAIGWGSCAELATAGIAAANGEPGAAAALRAVAWARAGRPPTRPAGEPGVTAASTVDKVRAP